MCEIYRHRNRFTNVFTFCTCTIVYTHRNRTQMHHRFVSTQAVFPKRVHNLHWAKLGLEWDPETSASNARSSGNHVKFSNWKLIADKLDLRRTTAGRGELRQVLPDQGRLVFSPD